ncbi:hypothetical protein Acr_00g0012110 [Actinidia rufa]|uniref:Uncharacterized protein n=1 Tax=Actinidia rufa TaxID=165716 RepID=A0A7J0D9M7_9ERIC|nr:hypothetical protein Acr_00g0012110 [Actinidia rufa]
MVQSTATMTGPFNRQVGGGSTWREGKAGGFFEVHSTSATCAHARVDDTSLPGGINIVEPLYTTTQVLIFQMSYMVKSLTQDSSPLILVPKLDACSTVSSASCLQHWTERVEWAHALRRHQDQFLTLDNELEHWVYA